MPGCPSYIAPASQIRVELALVEGDDGPLFGDDDPRYGLSTSNTVRLRSCITLSYLDLILVHFVGTAAKGILRVEKMLVAISSQPLAKVVS